MADHRHGEYGHDHDGGDEPHIHESRALPQEPPAEESAAPPEAEGDSVAVAAIEAVQETAEHAIDAMVVTHEQEEETERAEAIADALSDVAEAAAEAEPEPGGPMEESSMEPEAEEDEAGDGESEHVEDEEVTDVVPPQPDEAYNRRAAQAHRREVSKFRSRRMHR